MVHNLLDFRAFETWTGFFESQPLFRLLVSAGPIPLSGQNWAFCKLGMGLLENHPQCSKGWIPWSKLTSFSHDQLPQARWCPWLRLKRSVKDQKLEKNLTAKFPEVKKNMTSEKLLFLSSENVPRRHKIWLLHATSLRRHFSSQKIENLSGRQVWTL